MEEEEEEEAAHDPEEETNQTFSNRFLLNVQQNFCWTQSDASHVSSF